MLKYSLLIWVNWFLGNDLAGFIMQKNQHTEDIFIKAQEVKKKLLLTYFSGEHNLFLTKVCVPLRHLDPISEKGPDFYYFWDENGDVGDRLFGLPPSDIKYMELTDETYNPKDYIVPSESEI
jgi:hypothetical protein